MENTFNINIAIANMKDKAIVTTGVGDYFALVNNAICYKFNGSSISLSLDDFIKLFKDCNFSIVEDCSFVVDDLKDKEYYEKYKK